MKTSSKAFVRLHDAILFDADFGYQAAKELTANVFLKAGYHPISVYLLKKSTAFLTLPCSFNKAAASS